MFFPRNAHYSIKQKWGKQIFHNNDTACRFERGILIKFIKEKTVEYIKHSQAKLLSLNLFSTQRMY